MAKQEALSDAALHDLAVLFVSNRISTKDTLESIMEMYLEARTRLGLKNEIYAEQCEIQNASNSANKL